MPALHVRDLDDAVIDALKERAAANRRSLQGELKSILEGAAQMSAKGTRRRKLRLKTVSVGGRRSFSRDEIYEDDGR